MTREHAQTLLPIITAYAEGEEIEYWSALSGCWEPCTMPLWTDHMKYRIKPEPDPYAELKAAHAAGKVIQWDTSGKGNWIDLHNIGWGDAVDQYRIKPTPKLVPLASDDLPPVVWVRRAKFPEVFFSVVSLQAPHFYCVAGAVYVENWPLWEWSPDRKTWHSFMKEVEA